MKRVKLDRSLMPSYWPIGGTATWWLLLDRLQAPQWVWGATGVLVLIVWIAVGVAIFTSTYRRPKWDGPEGGER